jgi:PAS domain S-box-containing protein
VGTADVAIIVQDAGERVIGWSAVAQALLGWSAQEMLGTSAAAVHGASDSAAWVHRDGRVLAVRATAVPVADRSGKLLATVRLLRPVAADASQSGEQPAGLEAALDLVPISVLTLGEDGHIAHANAAACRLLGHPAGALTATAMGDLIAGSLRATDPHPGCGLADIVIETTLRRQDGTAFAAELRIAAKHSGKNELLLVSLADVSARAAAEQGRRTSEQKLRALVDSSAQMVWTTDANGAATEDSPSWRAYTGQTYEQQRGLGYLDAVHADDRGRIEAQWRDALAQRESVAFEYRARTPEGGWRWLSTRAAPVFDAERRVTSWVGMNMDISERKREQALAHGQTEVLEMIARGRALHETLDRLLQVVEAYSDSMFTSILLLDVDGAHLRHGAAPRLPAEYNRAIDGVAIGPSVGSCGTAAFTGQPVYAEDIQTDPRWKDFKDLAGAHGLRACWSTPIKDSEDRILGTFAIYYRQPGLPTERDLRLIELATQTAAISIERHRNEVESKASERRYRELEQALHEGESNNRALLEALADGVFVAQGERFVFVNPALPAMLGYGVEQFVGRHFADVVAPEYLGVWRERYARRIAKGPEPLRHYEVQFLRADGTRIWVELRASRVTYKGAPGVLGIIRDVSEAHEMHERLRKSESQCSRWWSRRRLRSPCSTAICAISR